MISLKANNITAGYGGVDIINNLNLFVNEGEIVVIVGPNGAGKSTCLLYTSPSPRDRQKSRMPSSA